MQTATTYGKCRHCGRALFVTQLNFCCKPCRAAFVNKTRSAVEAARHKKASINGVLTRMGEKAVCERCKVKVTAEDDVIFHNHKPYHRKCREDLWI